MTATTDHSPPVVDTLPVSEVFHDTIQGEGPAAGRSASFVRLMGCNLSCSWCDTSYTWDATRHDLRAGTQQRTAADLVADLASRRGIVVLTGGEPLLHQDRPAFRSMVERLVEVGRPVHVETNGTIAPSDHLLQYAELLVVSPKLDHAGPHRGHQDPRPHPAWADVAPRRPSVVFKVVCQDTKDVDAAVMLAIDMNMSRSRVWVMPEGRTVAELAARWPTIAHEAARHGLSATHRLHVLAWGEERGR
jgi:7-carboxy-7-deazaguanine synthase